MVAGLSLHENKMRKGHLLRAPQTPRLCRCGYDIEARARESRHRTPPRRFLLLSARPGLPVAFGACIPRRPICSYLGRGCGRRRLRGGLSAMHAALAVSSHELVANVGYLSGDVFWGGAVGSATGAVESQALAHTRSSTRVRQQAVHRTLAYRSINSIHFSVMTQKIRLVAYAR
jgi:hypothetical protein